MRKLPLILGGIVLFGFLAVFLLIPMLSLVWVSFTGEPVNVFGMVLRGDFGGLLSLHPSLHYYQEFFTTRRYYTGLINSLVYGGTVTFGCCLLGVALALIMARTAIPFKNVLRVMAVFPLAVPPYLMALSFIILFGRGGIVTRLMHVAWDPFTPLGAVLVQVFAFFPLIFLTTSATLERLDPSMEEAASMLGAERVYSFFTVSLPLLLPGIAAGAFLTFIRSFGDFATPLLLMPERVKLIVVEAYRDMSGNTYWGGASTLSTMMVLVILVILALQKYGVERNRFETLTGKAIAQPRLFSHRGICLVLFVVTALVLAFPLLNLAVIGLLSISREWGSTLFPTALTLEHYRQVLIVNPSAVINSWLLCLAALAGALVLALAVAWTIHRTKFWGRHVLDFTTLLPFIIPGTAFAIGLVTVFNEPPLALHLTVTLVVIAYVVTRAPYAVRSIMASFQQIGPSMEESSKTLGGTGTLTLWKVLIPLVRPGILAGGIMIFISCMTDVAITIMVCPPAAYPASQAIFSEIAESHYFAASAYGIILMAIIFVPYVIMLRMTGMKDMSM
ncbi:MAG: ABC transporter permease [Candidatus Xenobia bacterium]